MQMQIKFLKFFPTGNFSYNTILRKVDNRVQLRLIFILEWDGNVGDRRYDSWGIRKRTSLGTGKPGVPPPSSAPKLL